jgi:ATP-dependent phosphofructokinase / diphosphate-dependent phosphofructokinase
MSAACHDGAMRIGVLTGGGDCPGLNPAIRAVVRKCEVRFGDEVIGFRDGWRGVIEDSTMPLDVERCRGILPRGGTILGTSRTNPYRVDNGPERAIATLERHAIDALIAIGGEDTLGVANKLAEQGVPVVGIPKTIDNDLSETDVTIGFDTAVQIAAEAIDRLHTTAESHHRVIVCEVMGRHAGWIATYAGIAGGATVILVPEEAFAIESVCDYLRHRHSSGSYASIVVTAEGAKPAEGTLAIVAPELDQFGHERLGGIGTVVAEEVERRTGYESRVTILGHIQRGGTPSAFDRVLATRFGTAAVEAAHDGDWRQMVALHGAHVERVPIADAVAKLKTLDPELFRSVAEVFFG